jgi:hypothetical protein
MTRFARLRLWARFPWGLASGGLVEPRFTRDVDIVVAVPSDDAAETLVFDLGARGYRVGAIVEQEAVGRLSTARLQAPVGGAVSLFVDLLFASSGIEAEIVRDADRLEVQRRGASLRSRRESDQCRPGIDRVHNASRSSDTRRRGLRGVCRHRSAVAGGTWRRRDATRFSVGREAPGGARHVG